MMDYIYFIVRQILVILFLYMGLHMVFVKLRDEIKYTSFYKSYRMMGVAFIFISLSCFTHTLQNKPDSQPDIQIAISLICCYLIFMMMSKALIILLGKTLRCKSRIAILGLMVIFPIPLWLGIEFGDAEVISRILTASYTYFVLNVILLSLYILKTHNQALNNTEKIYTKDIAICLNWISKSKKLFVGLIAICVLAPAVFLCPRWLRYIYMGYGVLCYYRIYYGYNSMMMNITCYHIEQNKVADKLTAVKQSAKESDNILLNSEITDLISARLEEWVSQKRYTQSGLTIIDVARYIGTNRTYLSKYINTTYNCSFRVWVTELRIEEAKILLSTDLNLLINNVSSSMGFASTESFTHTFTRTVGKSPDKWRKARQ